MKNTFQNRSRIGDKTLLLLKFNYTSSLLSFLLSIICYYGLRIVQIIPFVFFGYSILNMLNVLGFKRHQNLTIMAIVTSVLSLVSTITITLFSGGIQSAFIFVLPVIVLAGYISTSVFGRIYLYSILMVILLIYIVTITEPAWLQNVVPETSKDLFNLLSLLFSIYLLEGVFGTNLLKAHFKLRATKQEVERKINEKENLLKEVHHRVKNNLQTISSLLSLQSRNTEDKGMKRLLKSSQNRVIAMAMIHQMLYSHEDTSKIDYGYYVRELVEHLVRSIKGTSANIDLDIDIQEMKLNIDTAIPLGLLVNEVVTNALKYGILKDQKGEIAIRMQETNGKEFVLKIGDNGVGFSDSITHKNTKTMGLKLIHNLVRQLQGSFERSPSTRGTHYTFRFREISDEIPATS